MLYMYGWLKMVEKKKYSQYKIFVFLLDGTSWGCSAYFPGRRAVDGLARDTDTHGTVMCALTGYHSIRVQDPHKGTDM